LFSTKGDEGWDTMIIHKVLNNNLVASQDEKGKEIILRGKGIGFQRKYGDEIPKEEIERVFIPVNKEESRYFQELIPNIPIEYLTIAEEILNYARTVQQLDITDSIILPLCDHIAGMADRYQNGIRLNHPLLFDIPRLYPKEFNVGLMALTLFETKLNIITDENEAAFLVFHFVNNQLNANKSEEIYPVTDVIKGILEIVEAGYQITLDKEEWNYQRFVTHLKFFAQRLLQKAQYTEEDDCLFQTVKEKYPQVYQCIVKIADHLYEKYKYDLNKEEMLYLMLHVERVTRNIEK